LERPGEALAAALDDAGVDRVLALYPANRRRLARLGLQALAVDMLVHEYSVCRLREPAPCRPLPGSDRIALPRGGVECWYAVVPRCQGQPVVSWTTLLGMLPNPPLPAVAIDLSFTDMHTPDELSSLRVQLSVSLGVVREWLWDPHLVLAGYSPSGVEEMLSGLVGRHKVTVAAESPGRVLWAMGADRVIVLRPDAPQALTTEEVRSAHAFVVGGIVDRIPRPAVSRRLDARVPWGVPRRIELRGSVVGVPHRINRIVEIILKARYAMSLEEAIVSSMTRRDRVLRLMRELSRASHGGRRRVPAGFVEELRGWLAFDCIDLRIAASKARVEVDPGACGEG